MSSPQSIVPQEVVSDIVASNRISNPNRDVIISSITPDPDVDGRFRYQLLPTPGLQYNQYPIWYYYTPIVYPIINPYVNSYYYPGPYYNPVYTTPWNNPWNNPWNYGNYIPGSNPWTYRPRRGDGGRDAPDVPGGPVVPGGPDGPGVGRGRPGGPDVGRGRP